MKKGYSEGELLLRAILRNPREDAPRLGYADWLEENAKGQPDRDRAEFIRLGIEFYNAFRYAGNTHTTYTASMADRILTLFEDNAKTRKWPEYEGVFTWEQDCHVQIDGVLGAIKGGGCRIRRGFPYWLNYRCSYYLKDARRWFRNFPITVVYLNDKSPEPSGVERSYVWRMGYTTTSSSLSKTLYELMPSDWEYNPSDHSEDPHRILYPYKDYYSGIREAEESLMVGAIRLGKKLANLPHGVNDVDLFA